MHDYAATFYGGYDQVVVRRAARMRLSWLWVALAAALLVLVALVASDVAAVEALPPVLHVTQVGWYAEGYLLVAGAGFSVRGGESAVLPLVCTSLCLPWVGANASAPFVVTGFSVVDRPSAQYTNVTVRAGDRAFSGPLAVTLELPAL